MGNYLIPANSKKSKLILGFFTTIDLIIFSVGVTVTIALLFAISSSNLTITIFKLLPALVAAFLVMPVPNYHNMFTLINNIRQYLKNPKKYRWRGWCGNGEK